METNNGLEGKLNVLGLGGLLSFGDELALAANINDPSKYPLNGDSILDYLTRGGLMGVLGYVMLRDALKNNTPKKEGGEFYVSLIGGTIFAVSGIGTILFGIYKSLFY